MSSHSGVGHRPRSVENYLVSGERVVVSFRRHWVVIAEPWLTAILSLLFVAWLTFDVASPTTSTSLMWWLWFALFVRAIWMAFDHSRTWFLATDRRLLLVYGVLVRRVAMMPLGKVTDMSYQRSPLGYLLGYGTFVLESAGQEQALREIDHVPDPDVNYRAIVAQIFHKDSDDQADAEDANAADDASRGGYDASHAGHAPEYGESWDDDPTSRYAISEGESRRWGERLRGGANRAGRGAGSSAWLRGRQQQPGGAAPDPTVGAQHRANPGVGDHGGDRNGDRNGTRDVGRRGGSRDDDADGGEWLYRGGSTQPTDDRREPPRDATGYWG